MSRNIDVFFTCIYKKLLALCLFLFIVHLTANSQTITTTPIASGSYCAGVSLGVAYTIGGTFNAGNIFTVELSNATGSFASPTSLGTVTSVTAGTITATLPLTQAAGTQYRVRVVSSNPVVTGTNNGSNLTVAALGINAPTVASPICQGATFNITNNLLNACAFGSGNTFTVQLSDATGSFASPIAIGSGATGGAVLVTIPQTQATGAGYQVRIVSSNPLIISPATSALTIKSPTLNAPTGIATRCAGSSFTLINNVASCSFFAGNTFTAQLSDATGSFASPTTIGSVNATSGGNIPVTLPLTATTGSNYLIQVVSSNPVTISVSSAAFTINGFGIAAPTIAGGSSSFCQGQNITVNYTIISGCAFPNSPSGNVFTAQLSDASGSFVSPTTIGFITTNGSGAISANLGNPVAGNGYRIRVVSSNPGTGVIGLDNGTNLSIASTAGNPSVFGVGGWNAYVYNSNTINGFTGYTGFYTTSGLNINTANSYGTSSSPSTALGYTGCTTVGATNYGIAFKQTNFTCGYYQIDVPFQDDQVAIYINGTLAFKNTVGTGALQKNVWSDFLNPSSTVEIRFVNGGGPGQLQINLYNPPTPITVSPNVTQCSSPAVPTTLTVSSPLSLSYAWTPTTGLLPSNGLGASVTAAPPTTTTYTVTATDAATLCTLTGTVTVTVSNVTPVITITKTPNPFICASVTTTTLTASGATSYTWSPAAGLSATTGVTVIANPAVTTTYTVIGNNGCTNGTGTASITVQNIPVTPPTTQFGNGVWNVSCYNSTDFTNYYGYYTINPISFNTTTYWTSGNGPSVPKIPFVYTGCVFPGSYYSESFKRTGFTCGYYQIDINNQDDQCIIFVDGVQVFQNLGYSATLQSNVWTGFLGPASQVEIRHINFPGVGSLQITFSPSTNFPMLLSSPITVCAGTTTTLSATTSLPGATFVWTNGVPANNGTIASPGSAITTITPLADDTYTCTLTDTGNTGCTSSNGVAITVNPLASTALSVSPSTTSTYCAGSPYTFKASGASSYTWSSSPADPTLSSTTGFQVTAQPTVTTIYTVSGSTNCPPDVTANKTITINPIPAITTFPSGKWNVYGFNSTTVGTNYSGYYTTNGSGASGYDFNTSTQWSNGSPPSNANATNGTAWLGCTMAATNISLSFKRTGFVCGVYQVNVLFEDDNASLWVNGVKVFQNGYNPNVQTNVWTGLLNPTTTVEWQLIQGGGGSGLTVQFVPVPQTPGTSLWTGVISTDWFNASNWCGAVPTSTTDAFIGSGPVNMPAIATAGAQVRTVTINALASLTTTATNNLDVFGNWISNGTYTANSGTISFVGSSGSTINSTGTTTFNNLMINNSGGITISSGNHQVNGVMTFSSGVVTQNSVLNMLNGSSVSGANNSSYVDGPLTKIGNTSFVFPAGNGGFFAPLSLSAPLSTADNFTAQYIHASANSTYSLAQVVATLEHVSAAEHWFLKRNSGTSNVSVGLSWNTPRSGGVGNLPSLRVTRWDATTSKWTDQGSTATTGNTSSGTVTSAAVTSLGTANNPFTLGTTDNLNVLPIQLTNYSCSGLPDGTVKLIWTTKSELNNDHFDIERSGDIVSFSTIGAVRGAGTTAQEHHYSFVDVKPLPGKSYYRLVQTDFDGHQTRSEVCLSENNATLAALTIYPNPASLSATILYSNIGSVLGMRLFNQLGQEVAMEAETLESGFRINTSGQTNGVYVIQLATTTGNRTLKLIVAR